MKSLIYSSEKEVRCRGSGQIGMERKSYIKVRSDEMLISKDEKFAKEWEKTSQGPSHPQNHKEIKRSCRQKRNGEPGRWRSAVISRASLFRASRELSKCSPYSVPSHNCHAWLCGEPRRGQHRLVPAGVWPQRRGLWIFWLDVRIWKLTKRLCPH